LLIVIVDPKSAPSLLSLFGAREREQARIPIWAGSMVPQPGLIPGRTVRGICKSALLRLRALLLEAPHSTPSPLRSRLLKDCQIPQPVTNHFTAGLSLHVSRVPNRESPPAPSLTDYSRSCLACLPACLPARFADVATSPYFLQLTPISSRGGRLVETGLAPRTTAGAATWLLTRNGVPVHTTFDRCRG
jgi:hypothetical protein